MNFLIYLFGDRKVKSVNFYEIVIEDTFGLFNANPPGRKVRTGEKLERTFIWKESWFEMMPDYFRILSSDECCDLYDINNYERDKKNAAQLSARYLKNKI